MKKTILAALALVALAPPAHAVDPGPGDRPCRFVAATDPSPGAPPGWHTGVIEGGPVMQNGVLTCAIQVGNDNPSATDNARAQAWGGNGFTYLPPTQIAFYVPPQTPVYLCTQFTDDRGETSYYDASTGLWHDFPTPCPLAISAGTNDPVFDPVFDTLDLVLAVLAQLERDVVDPIACPVLALLAPGVPGVVDISPEGDVFVLGERLWDCPPYDF